MEKLKIRHELKGLQEPQLVQALMASAEALHKSAKRPLPALPANFDTLPISKQIDLQLDLIASFCPASDQNAALPAEIRHVLKLASECFLLPGVSRATDQTLLIENAESREKFINLHGLKIPRSSEPPYKCLILISGSRRLNRPHSRNDTDR